MVDLMVCLAMCLNRLERRLCKSSADRGTEVDVPPNQFPAASLIIAATVVGPLCSRLFRPHKNISQD